MLLRKAFLAVAGLSAGGTIAAGVYAFLAIIGIFPRIIGKTGTRKSILVYETLIIIGGTLGNVSDLFELPIPLGRILGMGTLAVFGLAVGIFVGCLVMSLAEVLKALPTFSRRIGLAVGLQYLILAIALGKLAGSILYFWQGFGLSQ